MFLSVRAEQPSEARGFVHRRIGRALGGLARRGAGFLAGQIPVVGPIVGPLVSPAPQRFTPQRQGPGSTTTVQLPPTPTITTPAERSTGAEFQAVTGAFDLPAMAPFAITGVRLDCPKGMVLGKDDLCYPKAVLRRNSTFRKWRSGARPTITRADEKALGRIAAVQKDIKTLGKKAGLKVTG